MSNEPKKQVKKRQVNNRLLLYIIKDVAFDCNTAAYRISYSIMELSRSYPALIVGYSSKALWFAIEDSIITFNTYIIMTHTFTTYSARKIKALRNKASK